MPEHERVPVSGLMAVHGAPPEVLGPHALPQLDYGDLFTATTSTVGSAEEWARALFGDTPDALMRVIFAGLCRFRLQRGVHEDRVAGCPISHRSADHVVVELCGPVLVGRLVVSTAPGCVAMATQMRYRSRRGRVLWTTLSPVHRRLAPGLLRQAEEKLRAR